MSTHQRIFTKLSAPDSLTTLVDVVSTTRRLMLCTFATADAAHFFRLNADRGRGRGRGSRDRPAAAAAGDRFATGAGCGPRALAIPYRWFSISPRRIQARREVNEPPGRELMCDGRWMV